MADRAAQEQGREGFQRLSCVSAESCSPPRAFYSLERNMRYRCRQMPSEPGTEHHGAPQLRSGGAPEKLEACLSNRCPCTEGGHGHSLSATKGVHEVRVELSHVGKAAEP